MDSKLLTLIKEAIILKATDIHLNFKNGAYICEFRIYGKLILFCKYEEVAYQKLINYLRYISNLQTNQIFEPQTGGFDLKIENHQFFFRTSYLMSSDRETIVIRILNQSSTLNIEDLTYDLNAIGIFKEMACLNSGLILFSGPTGSGKSTTVYTILEHIAMKTNKCIVTIEDPIEKNIAGAIQLQLNEKQGHNYDQLLRQILRHDPDIIFVGEIRDALTARITQRCALTGHLVIATVHAFNTSSVITRMVDLGVSVNELLITTKYIFNQRLFYHKNNFRPFCLYEYLNCLQIKAITDGNSLNYVTIDERIVDACNRGYLNIEQRTATN